MWRAASDVFPVTRYFRILMQANKFTKYLRTWWGRSLAGAFVGGLLVAFSGIDDPAWFLAVMAAGALVMYFLGRLE
jgi:hypothetical protein